MCFCPEFFAVTVINAKCEVQKKLSIKDIRYSNDHPRYSNVLSSEVLLQFLFFLQQCFSFPPISSQPTTSKFIVSLCLRSSLTIFEGRHKSSRLRLLMISDFVSSAFPFRSVDFRFFQFCQH